MGLLLASLKVVLSDDLIYFFVNLLEQPQYIVRTKDSRIERTDQISYFRFLVDNLETVVFNLIGINDICYAM